MTAARRDSVDAETIVDAVDLELIRTGLQAISDLVKDDLTRTAFSPIVYEYKDFAVGVVDPDGRLISMGMEGIPMLFLGVVADTIRDGIETYGRDDIHEGDVFISNSVATMGQHLNNVLMYTPVFDRTGDLSAFIAVAFHWLDIGGIAPGSGSSTDTELTQEGLQLRSIRLYRHGEPVAEIFRIIELNTRLPKALLGDIAAQYAGCLRGKSLFEGLLARYGRTKLDAAIAALWDKGEAAARAAIVDAPDGDYRWETFLDNDGVGVENIRVAVRVVIDGDRFIVDFSDLGAQGRGPFNSGRNGGAPAATYLAFLMLFGGDQWVTEGLLRPVEIILPEGTFLSASDTAARAFFQTPLPTVLESILAAVAPVMPERVMAGTQAAFGAYWFAGRDPRTGEEFQVMDSALGGWGATSSTDGMSPFRTVLHVDSQDIPMETSELTAPILFESYRWRQDSEGAGRFRGGPGLEKTVRVLSECTFSSGFERSEHPSWGLFGGGGGKAGGVVIERIDGTSELVQKVPGIVLGAGDRVRIQSGGGGGFGPSRERLPDLVLSDLSSGLISDQRALDVYGVVFDGQQLDLHATIALRALEHSTAANDEAALERKLP